MHREFAWFNSENKNIYFFFRKVWKVERGVIRLIHGLPDRSHGAYDFLTGQFTTPVDGRYRFQIFMATYGGTGYYSISLRVDTLTFDTLCGTYGMDTAAHEDSRTLVSEIELRTGQVVDFFVDDSSYGLTGDHSSYPYGVQTGRSFIQGQLIKRLWEFGLIIIPRSFSDHI